MWNWLKQQLALRERSVQSEVPRAASKPAHRTPRQSADEVIAQRQRALERDVLSKVRAQRGQSTPVPNEDFITSMAVANATECAVIGYAVGGSMPGAVFGASVGHSLHEEARPAITVGDYDRETSRSCSLSSSCHDSSSSSSESATSES